MHTPKVHQPREHSMHSTHNTRGIIGEDCPMSHTVCTVHTTQQASLGEDCPMSDTVCTVHTTQQASLGEDCPLSDNVSHYLHQHGCWSCWKLTRHFKRHSAAICTVSNYQKHHCQPNQPFTTSATQCLKDGQSPQKQNMSSHLHSSSILGDTGHNISKTKDFKAHFRGTTKKGKLHKNPTSKPGQQMETWEQWVGCSWSGLS